MDDWGRLLSGCRSKIRPRVRIPASPLDKRTAFRRFFSSRKSKFYCCLPARVVVFRPTNSLADLDLFTALAFNCSIKMPDHLMNF